VGTPDAENVERFRRYHELLNETGEIAVEFLDPDVEMRMFRGSPIPGPYRGHDGVRRWREDTFDVIDQWRMELDEVITGDDPDVLVALHRFVGRMKHTDLPANFPLAVVVRFRGGLIADLEGHRELSDALAAAGIEPAAPDAHRAREWVHSAQEAVCDVVEPWEHGTVIRATRYPTYFDLNLVRVEDDAELTAGEVIRFADEALAGLPHRQVGFEVVEAGERVREGLEAAGYQSQRLVWMRHQGGEPVSHSVDVEEVPYDDVHELRVRWHEEDFPTLDTRDYFDHAREIAMRRDPRVFAVLEGGTPIAFAEVEHAGDAAEVASVYVHPDHRGAGLGTALTQAAIDSARDARDLWIVTDDEGRARPIYERLGFRSAWKILSFLRLPPE
jgi:GNAT superfamily N-acetyltransferase/ketosteroid isomerase-like protein